MLRSIKLFAFIILFTTAFSCDKDSDPTPPANVSFTATLTGANEVPANASTATGSSTGNFNPTTKILTVITTYTGVTATAGHIHKGADGVAGPVVFPFTNLASPINFTSATALDATQEADLMANLYYVNIHSAAYPGGEIRGQLTKQ